MATSVRAASVSPHFYPNLKFIFGARFDMDPSSMGIHATRMMARRAIAVLTTVQRVYHYRKDDSQTRH